MQYVLVQQYEYAQRERVDYKPAEALLGDYPQHEPYCDIAGDAGCEHGYRRAVPGDVARAVFDKVGQLKHRAAEYGGHGEQERELRRLLFFDPAGKRAGYGRTGARNAGQYGNALQRADYNGVILYFGILR